MSVQQHHQQSAGLRGRVAVLTLSDSRTLDTDTSGQRISELLAAAGHAVADRRLIADDATLLRATLHRWLSDDRIDAIITTGGTGISHRDQTVPVICSLLTIQLPGFGELFRMLSYESIGSAAFLSRAVGGVAGEKPIFALPGSTDAVELAVGKLILPELPHLLQQLRR